MFGSSLKRAPLLALITSGKAFECSTATFQAILPQGVTALTSWRVAQNGTFGDSAELAYPGNSTALPSLCAVTFEAASSESSSYRFGLFLPDEWNNRFLTVGNDGAAGGIKWPSMGVHVKYGFATASTDTGHNSTSADFSWIYANNSEQIADYGYRAMHGTVQYAKAIVTSYYSSKIDYSYYTGCSSGGRQGTVELQRYPDDFDGILIGAPAWELQRIGTTSLRIAEINSPNTSDHYIDPSLYPVISAEAVRQCDLNDGVADNIISKPYGCNFRTELLLCNSTQTSSCLTAPQINTLNQIYGRLISDDTPISYFPIEIGSEVLWNQTVRSTTPDQVTASNMQHDILQSYKADIVPDNFDLLPFQSKGGKVIHFHGLSDQLIPESSSRSLYEHYYVNMTTQGVAMDSFYKYYQIPSMLHCHGSAGFGISPWYLAGSNQADEELGTSAYGVPGFEDERHNALLALMGWVEKGHEPQEIVVTKYKNERISEGVQSQRKVCPYPQVARFKGGDLWIEESWECI